MFNALKYIKSLESVGLSRPQAEAHVELVMKAIEEQVATKSDMIEMRTELGHVCKDLDQGFTKLALEIDKVRFESSQNLSDVRLEMSKMENRLMLRFGSLLIACMTLQTGILGFLMTYKLK